MARKRRPESLLREIRQQPKTDYTYCETQSYRVRVTPERSVTSPNMSRRDLHTGSSMYRQSKDFSDHSQEIQFRTPAPNKNLRLRSRNVLRRTEALDKYSDLSDEENDSVARNTRSGSAQKKKLSASRTPGVSRTLTRTSTTTTTISSGLDAESDAEGPMITTRPVPLVGRGGTPLGGSLSTGQTTTMGQYRSSLSGLQEENENPIISWAKQSTTSFTRILSTICTTIILSAISVTTYFKEGNNTDSQTDEINLKDKNTSQRSSFAFENQSSNIYSSKSGDIYYESINDESNDNGTVISRITKSIMTRFTKVQTTTEWYKEKVRGNALLWCWLPLLLLLLLLTVFGAYWWLLLPINKGETNDADGTDKSKLFLFSSIKDSISYVISNSIKFFSFITDNLLLVLNQVVDAVLWVAVAINVAIYSTLSYIVSGFYLVLDYLWIFVNFIYNLIVNAFSNLYNILFYVSDDKSEAVLLPDDSKKLGYYEWMSNYSPVSYVTNAYQSLSLMSMINTVYGGIANSLTYFSNIVSSSVLICANTFTNGVILSSNWIWSVCVDLWLFVGGIVSSVFGQGNTILKDIWNSSGNILFGVYSSVIKSCIYLSSSGVWIFAGFGYTISQMFVYSLETIILLFGLLWSMLTSVVMGCTGAISSATILFGSTMSSVYDSSVNNFEKFHKMPLTSSWPEKDEESLPKGPPQLPVPSKSSVGNVDVSVDDVINKLLSSSQLRSLIGTISKNSIPMEQMEQIVKSTLQIQLERTKVQTDSLLNDVSQTKLSHVNLVNQISELQKQMTNLMASLNLLEEATDAETQRGSETRFDQETELLSLKANIKQLNVTIENLKTNHENLSNEVRSCCKNTSLTIADVERHVNTLLVDLMRPLGHDSEDDGDNESWSPDQMGMWLKTYFVAKVELENKLSEILDTINKNSIHEENKVTLTQETVEQTNQLVMNSVMEKIQLEMQQQHSKLYGEISMQVAQEIEKSSEAAKEELSIFGRKEATEAVSAAIDLTLPGAIDETVSVSIKETINVAVEEAAIIAIEKAVPSRVEQSVSAAINAVITEAIDKTVQGAKKETLSREQQEAIIAAAVKKEIPAIQEALVLEQAKIAGTHVPDNDYVEVLSATVNLTNRTSIYNNGNGNPNGFSFIHSDLMAGLNESQVMRIVKDALLKYDADKTGMVDYALESAGGNIISTRCTEGFSTSLAEWRVMGIPLYRYSTNIPRTIIQPGTNPGQCWAFKGTQGFIVIQLAGTVKPTGFSLEHIPKSLSPTGEIGSAPKNFTVYGLQEEHTNGVLLGTFIYDSRGEPLQYFPVDDEGNNEYFPFIELKIESNHGNVQYTCIYRFRVHGIKE